jgi:hypothetical protein
MADTIGSTWQLSGSLVKAGIGTLREQYVSRDMAGGRIVFRRKADLLSPQLRAARSGTFILPKVTLLTSVGKVTLINARIVSVEAAAPRPGQAKAGEELTFTFQQIEFEFL